MQLVPVQVSWWVYFFISKIIMFSKERLKLVKFRIAVPSFRDKIHLVEKKKVLTFSRRYWKQVNINLYVTLARILGYDFTLLTSFLRNTYHLPTSFHKVGVFGCKIWSFCVVTWGKIATLTYFQVIFQAALWIVPTSNFCNCLEHRQIWNRQLWLND